MPNRLAIILIEQARDVYFWNLMINSIAVARSKNIDTLTIIEAEVKSLCRILNCKYVIEKRKQL